MHFSAGLKYRVAVSMVVLTIVVSFAHWSGAQTTGAVSRATPGGFTLYGTNFTVSVPNVEAGQYTAVLGFVENEVTTAGQRLFDIKYRGQVAVSNLDVFTAAGGAGKNYFL